MTRERLVERIGELERELEKARAFTTTAQQNMAQGQQQTLLITGAITLAEEFLAAFEKPAES